MSTAGVVGNCFYEPKLPNCLGDATMWGNQGNSHNPTKPHVGSVLLLPCMKRCTHPLSGSVCDCFCTWVIDASCFNYDKQIPQNCATRPAPMRACRANAKRMGSLVGVLMLNQIRRQPSGETLHHRQGPTVQRELFHEELCYCC